MHDTRPTPNISSSKIYIYVSWAICASKSIIDSLKWDFWFNVLTISMFNTLIPFRSLIICGSISKEWNLHLEQLVWRVDSHCRKAKSNSYLIPLFLNYLKICYFILLGIRFNKNWIVGLSSYSGTYKVSKKTPFCFEKNVFWSMGVERYFN